MPRQLLDTWIGIAGVYANVLLFLRPQRFTVALLKILHAGKLLFEYMQTIVHSERLTVLLYGKVGKKKYIGCG